MKLNKCAKKRFRVSATGKIKYKHSGKNHIMTKKKPKTVRHLRGAGRLDDTNVYAVRRMLQLPVGGR
jgi:large subunit ribosomal protein L35